MNGKSDGGHTVRPLFFYALVQCSSVYQPGSSSLTTTTKPTATDAATFTEVTEDLYYKGGHLGRLEIPVLDLSVKIYEGTGSSTLAKGRGPL